MTLENSLDCKIKAVSHKGNQQWIFIGKTAAEAEAPILWPPNVKNWLIRKDPDAGKDWKQEDKGTTDDEIVGWHHRLHGHRFGWTLGVGDGQGGMACCGSWNHKESDTTEQLKWTELNWWILNVTFKMLSTHRLIYGRLMGFIKCLKNMVLTSHDTSIFSFIMLRKMLWSHSPGGPEWRGPAGLE